MKEGRLAQEAAPPYQPFPPAYGNRTSTRRRPHFSPR